ncbi:hypothetical protein [Paraburkholderia sp. BL25I1N1]|uniref:hypothetical protein n=1 Tax=Paraburkholderia sp. BL25I1N1 TaxID=1938804 RepID=UPI0011B262E0|nr:hypothetical protein [Paraburkholderia sp. BL25I1N1]
MNIVHAVQSASTGTLALARMSLERLGGEAHEIYLESSRRGETAAIPTFLSPNVQLRQFHMKSRAVNVCAS